MSKLWLPILSGFLLTGCNLINPQPKPTPTPSALPSALPAAVTLSTPVYTPYPIPTIQATLIPLGSPIPTPSPVLGAQALPQTGSGLKEVVELKNLNGVPRGTAQFAQNHSDQVEVTVTLPADSDWVGRPVTIREGNCQVSGNLIARLSPTTGEVTTTQLRFGADYLIAYSSLSLTVTESGNENNSILCGEIR